MEQTNIQSQVLTKENAKRLIRENKMDELESIFETERGNLSQKESASFLKFAVKEENLKFYRTVVDNLEVKEILANTLTYRASPNFLMLLFKKGDVDPETLVEDNDEIWEPKDTFLVLAKKYGSIIRDSIW